MKIAFCMLPVVIIAFLSFTGCNSGSSPEEYVSPTTSAVTGRSPGVKVKLISDSAASRTYAIIFAAGDEVMSGLTEFAIKNNVTSAHFTGIGDVSSAKFGSYNKDKKMFKVHELNQTAEITSLVGDIAIKDNKPVVHAHINLGTEDGLVHGGHLLEAFIAPTLEVMLTVEPVPLYKKLSPDWNAALIDLDAEK